MCGLAGLWQFRAGETQDLTAVVSKMADTMLLRGPDDSGVWADEQAGIALGFRRLAILDLSPLGHQPMHSAGNRYVIVFNGEIYNFAAIRDELQAAGHGFRGHSDTEVVLAAIEQWGLSAAVRRFTGMFAMAVWDGKTQSLSLVRDRIGIKPLYYGWAGSTFLFASELKALRAFPAWTPEIDRGALSLYARHFYIPAPYSIYKGIRKLLPGCIVEVRAQSTPAELSPTSYWSAKEVAERGVGAPFVGSESDAVDQLDELLSDAVRLRMIADVPLGAFLSGGVDSSTVVALMQAQSSRPVRTFSIGFNEQAFDEAPYAKSIASHLNTDHTEVYVTSAEAQAVIPRLPEMYDEPFADSSQIPTFLVSQIARRHVTVSLSGDGGDELFGGYLQYRSNSLRHQMHRFVPAGLRPPLGQLLRAGGSVCGAKTSGFLGRMAQRMYLEGRLLAEKSPKEMYREYLSLVSTPAEIVVDGWDPSTVFSDPLVNAVLPSFTEQMMYIDTICYLPDDILTKVDRASMAVSLEARVPLLDHRVVEFAWRLPLSYKIRSGLGKWILRQVLYRYVPRQLVERPKKGFAVPIGAWLRGPLRDWAEALLDERLLCSDGYWNANEVRSRWEDCLAGNPRGEAIVWLVLMFQAWRSRWPI